MFILPVHLVGTNVILVDR